MLPTHLPRSSSIFCLLSFTFFHRPLSINTSQIILVYTPNPRIEPRLRRLPVHSNSRPASPMAPNIQTQHDPNLRETKNDHLDGFDPIAVFGFSIKDPFPDEATIRARYHKLVRLIGVIYRADSRLPYTLAETNRARDNLLSNYRRTVEITRGYHRPTWNPAADECDLAALLTPVPVGYVARFCFPETG